MRRLLTFLFFIVCVCASLSGCATAAGREKAAKQKEETTLKKKHFSTLKKNIQNQALQTNILESEIEETYGKPDDIFHSGSGDSSFEIWTYEEITTQKDETGQPIRLYFNDGKLASWKY